LSEYSVISSTSGEVLFSYRYDEEKDKFIEIENEPGTGDAGLLIIKTGSLSLTNNSNITAETLGSGNGGNIVLDLNHLELSQNSQIESSTVGTGSAGTITITAYEDIQIVGDKSGIFSTASSTGKAGQIDILAGGTREEEPDVIQGTPFDARLIPRAVGGLFLDGGHISTSTTGEGDGGSITITSSQLKLGNQAKILAENQFPGFNRAGNIVIGAHFIDMLDSKISTSSTNASGGNILLGLREAYNNRITDSIIVATAGATGTGGNL
jgi:large exoprotein involved in heme utilization and adhesion